MGAGALLLIVAVVMAATIAIAVQIERKYEAKSSLLVLFGPEYSFRPAAGQPLCAGNSVEYEQVLQTEAEILGNDDLYRSVIADFGIERLYPELLKPPSEFAANSLRMRSCTWRSWQGDSGPKAAPIRPRTCSPGSHADVRRKSGHRRRPEIGCHPRVVQAPESHNRR